MARRRVGYTAGRTAIATISGAAAAAFAVPSPPPLSAALCATLLFAALKIRSRLLPLVLVSASDS